MNARLHALLHKIYTPELIDDVKKSLANEYSGGRTERTSELDEIEIKRLICSLESVVKRQDTREEIELTKAQRKLYALRKSLGWSYERLSEFIIQQTAGQKNHSRQLTDQELGTLISVMEKIEVDKYKQRNRS